MNFGPQTPSPTAIASWTTPRAGLNFFDTADVYAGRRARAGPKQIVGAGSPRAAPGARRPSFATKVYGDMGTGRTPAASRACTSAGLRKARCSRFRRTTSTVPDAHVLRRSAVEEIWQALSSSTARQGLYLARRLRGCNIAQAQDGRGSATSSAWQRTVPVQPLYRLVEYQVFPAAQHYGIGIIPWSPLAGGCSGASCKGEGRRRPRVRAEEVEQSPQLEKYERCARSSARTRRTSDWRGCQESAVTAPIIGRRTTEHYGSMHVLDVNLTTDTLKKLKRTSSRPTGPRRSVRV